MVNKKAKGKPADANGKVEFKGFFSPVVGDDAKTAVKALAQTGDSSMGRLVELVSVGFKVSIREDGYQTSYQLSLFDQRVGSDSAGYIMSVWHRDLATCVALAWFLQDEIYEWGGWGRWLTAKSDVDW